MTRLARVELRRLLRRRLTLFVVLGILAAVGLQLFQTGMQARPMSAGERARVSADYERARQDFAQNGEQQRADCLQSQAEARTSDPKADFGCDTMEPTLAMFLKPELRFAGAVPGVLTGGAVLLALAALVLGAGFTASEFTTGSIGTWLTFEPRRLRVYGSKLLAAGAGLVPLAVLTFALLTAGVWVFASLWGRTAAPAGTWSHVAAVAGRGVVLTAAVAVVGAALGFLLRHTAAVLGVALGYAIAGEGILAATSRLCGRGCCRPTSPGGCSTAPRTPWTGARAPTVATAARRSRNRCRSPTARRTSACSCWRSSCSPPWCSAAATSADRSGTSARGCDAVPASRRGAGAAAAPARPWARGAVPGPGVL